MKTAYVLSLVREAMKYARMETAEFGSIHRDSKVGRTQPVRNAAGELVTEANVSDFIRERVELHHGSWIIGTLEIASQELQSEVRHSFVEGHPIRSQCAHCRRPETHRSHTK